MQPARQRKTWGSLPRPPLLSDLNDSSSVQSEDYPDCYLQLRFSAAVNKQCQICNNHAEYTNVKHKNNNLFIVSAAADFATIHIQQGYVVDLHFLLKTIGRIHTTEQFPGKLFQQLVDEILKIECKTLQIFRTQI